LINSEEWLMLQTTLKTWNLLKKKRPRLQRKLRRLKITRLKIGHQKKSKI